MNSLEPFIERPANPFKSHWQAFIDKELTLKELEKVCFTWIIIHEELYQEKPLPTEPIDLGNVSAIKFPEIKKAWKYYCEKIVIENESNAKTLKDARNYFLNNDYDEGLKLYNQHKDYKEKPKSKEKTDNKDNKDSNETREILIKQMEKATEDNIKKAETCPF